ncbi:MAG: ATP-dependent DNA helicase RecG [Bacteroidia bacterium]
MRDILDTPIEYLKGVGPEKGKTLKTELGIETFGDLLSHYPFRYIDRSKFYKVAELTEDLPLVQLKGKLTRVEEITTGRSKRLTAHLTDESGSLELVWFAGINWIKKTLKAGVPYIVFGKPNLFGSRINMAHPELEPITAASKIESRSGLRPVYSTTEKLKKKNIDSKQIEKLIKTCLETNGNKISEFLTPEVLDDNRLIDRKIALFQIHFPRDVNALNKAKYRLKFEELLLLQLQILSSTKSRQAQLKGYPLPNVGQFFNKFYNEILPFELTGAQKRVVREIHHSTRTGVQMNRLLQGDVGSGKTLVALLAMLLAVDNGKQAAMMAPTEILAKQHFTNLGHLLKDLPINVRLLTGSTPQRERRLIHEELLNGECHILVGTHALIEDKVQFKEFAMAAVDEQHRFGVAQRAKLWTKSEIAPHVLVMTATPIPRTLAMTLYGDLETSVLDELPPGRKPIDTKHFFEKSRLQVHGFIKSQIEEGRQVYIVYPLIEESEKLDLNNLMEGYESICRAFPQSEYKVSVVHGRMKPDDKDLEMQRFKMGKTQIMVATTVIEVGVDVPNATVMVIENAERFGLSQLHQLRGRVGRGANKSFCVLITGHKLSREGRKRIETMVQTNDGFEIAEVDLELRGPGDIAGTQQSGLPNLKIASLVTDNQLITIARQSAKSILESDPNLTLGANSSLRIHLEKMKDSTRDWSKIS